MKKKVRAKKEIKMMVMNMTMNMSRTTTSSFAADTYETFIAAMSFLVSHNILTSKSYKGEVNGKNKT